MINREKAKCKPICFIITNLLFILLCLSSFAAVEEDSVELRVEKGDKLIHLGRKYLADPGKWREVARFNRLKNPNLILPGQRIKVPVRLLPGVPVEARVTFVYGEVKVQKDERTAWKVLNLGERVSPGSRIQTGKAGSLELTFEDHNSIFLKPNTALGIIVSEKKGSTYRHSNFFLDAGRAITKMKKATGSESRLEITTPSAVASGRGTEFRVSVDQAAATRTEVLEGWINVSAMEQTLEIRQGEGSFVAKGAPPISPQKLLPPPGPLDFKPIYKEIPLRFTFQEMPGLTSVRGLLTKDRLGREILEEKVVTIKDPLEWVNLPDGTYYLFTQGIDQYGIEGFQSQPFEVKLRVNPLPPLVSTRDNENEFIGKTTQFNWLKVKDAIRTHLQVAQDEAFTIIKEEHKDFQGESYQTGTLDYGKYYFRIRSIAQDGYEAGWSMTVPFSLIPPPPAPPLEKPKLSEKKIFLKWRPLGAGIRYHFQMSKNPEFKEILVDKKLDNPEISLEKPVDPGIYHIRTSSIDTKNREGDFSPSQSFEIKKPEPEKKEPLPYEMIIGILTAIGIFILLIP